MVALVFSTVISHLKGWDLKFSPLVSGHGVCVLPLLVSSGKSKDMPCRLNGVSI